MSWRVTGNKPIRAGAVVRSLEENKNRSLFMLSLGSWETPMEYIPFVYDEDYYIE